MSSPHDSSATRDLGAESQIAAICREFESRYKQGNPLTLEEALESWPNAHRLTLLLELIPLEEKYGKGTTTWEMYRRRFPELPDQKPELSREKYEIHCPGRFGKYELIEELGHGGMGVVYRAQELSGDGKLFRQVALKLVRPDRLAQLGSGQRNTFVARFHKEAKAAASLHHDNAVTVFEVGEVDGRHYYSMHFVDGVSLGDLIKAKRPLGFRKAAEYVRSAANAVHAAHQLGILHRDIKPDNILVDQSLDRAFVTDFGLAKMPEADQSLTVAGDWLGSPPYTSPEQARSADQVTNATDVYGLGATLYAALTGIPPFMGAGIKETLDLVIDKDPVLPRQINTAIPRDLETICLKCLEKEENRRYSSAAELAADLNRYLTDEPIHARRTGPLERARRWVRRNPLVATLSTAVVLAIITMFWMSHAARLNAEERATEEYRLRVRAEEAEETADHARDDALSTWRDSFNFVTKLVVRARGMSKDGFSADEVVQMQNELLERKLETIVSKQQRDPLDINMARMNLAVVAQVKEDFDAQENQYREAIKLFERLTKEMPADSATWRELGQAYYIRGLFYSQHSRPQDAARDFEMAFAAYERCLKCDGGEKSVNIVAWVLCSCPDAGFRDAERAIELAQQALRQKPDSAGRMHTLGVAYYRAERFEDAAKSLHKANEIRDENKGENDVWLAMIYYRRGDRELASKTLQSVLDWAKATGNDEPDLLRFIAEGRKLGIKLPE